MKKFKIIILLHLILILGINAQVNFETYFFNDSIPGNQSNNSKGYYQLNTGATKSSDGYKCSPRGTYRALGIFVNIIYDQTPRDTVMKYTSQDTSGWHPDTVNSINMYPPNYFQTMFDLELKPNYDYTGSVTRLYAESSFNQLLMLGDMMVVNIKQSLITPTNYLNGFNYQKLMNSVISFINERGGMNTLYGHNNMNEYDKTAFEPGATPTPDQKIDLFFFFTRNTFYKQYKDKDGKVILTHNYGTVNLGGGLGNISISSNLLVGSVPYGFNIGNYQCVGGGSIAVHKKSVLTHEIAHFYLGDNAFHTSGGVTDNDSYYNTFIGHQQGYGLFAGGLSTCNGYERWRLGWKGPTNDVYDIATNNENSDILTKFSGERTFTLRDFVTYGDVIRIKLPYKDSEYASNQYIWLENHQVGKNGKFDSFQYTNPGTCRDVDKAGIYAYYQVGKDIHESSDRNTVFPTNEKDNLRIISAEGNFNVEYAGMWEDCLMWSGGAGRPRITRLSYGDQTSFMYKLIEKLDSAESAVLLQSLNLTEAYQLFRTAQNDFESLFADQVKANAALREMESATSLRGQLTYDLRNYLGLVNAMRNIENWKSLYRELKELVTAARNSDLVARPAAASPPVM